MPRFTFVVEVTSIERRGVTADNLAEAMAKFKDGHSTLDGDEYCSQFVQAVHDDRGNELDVDLDNLNLFE